MNFAARLPTLLAAGLIWSGCTAIRSTDSASPAIAHREATTTPAEPLTPSPRLIVGRVLATDPVGAFAWVDLVFDAPAGALGEGAELTTRTFNLRPTGTLRTSRYMRGRTLGTQIVSGQPTPGDEVVWLAP